MYIDKLHKCMKNNIGLNSCSECFTWIQANGLLYCIICHNPICDKCQKRCYLCSSRICFKCSRNINDKIECIDCTDIIFNKKQIICIFLMIMKRLNFYRMPIYIKMKIIDEFLISNEQEKSHINIHMVINLIFQNDKIVWNQKSR